MLAHDVLDVQAAVRDSATWKPRDWLACLLSGREPTRLDRIEPGVALSNMGWLYTIGQRCRDVGTGYIVND